ncbi:MAG: VWA domain-containing protein [Actinomycetia bacterium]|nr:VWA domain-containing protein [Actinomycetes bacterium]
MQVAVPFFLLSLPVLLLFGYIAKRFLGWPKVNKPKHIAESATLQNLPSFAKLASRQRIFRWVERGFIGLVLIMLALLAARPQNFVQKVNEEESRDIVLCLDGSGSMQENISPSLEVMKEIVNENPTDRYAIVIFQTASFPALPLTRDVVAINDTIDRLLELDENGSLGLSLAGYSPDSKGGTDVGEGMIGCLRRFADLDTLRSRHVILITDLEHNGETNPRDIAALYAKYSVATEVIVPANAYSYNANNAAWLNLANAEITELDDGDDFKSVLNRLYGSILNKDDISELVAADNPTPYYVGVSLSALALGGLRLAQERRKK